MRTEQFNRLIRREERGLPGGHLGGVFQLAFLVISLAIPKAGVGQVKVHAVLQDPTSTKPVDDPVRGRQLFIKDGCFECHGTEGQGGGYTGPRIAPPPPLSSVLSQLRHPPIRCLRLQRKFCRIRTLRTSLLSYSRFQLFISHWMN